MITEYLLFVLGKRVLTFLYRFSLGVLGFVHTVPRAD